MTITWLASYPKSGNTWTRAFLTAYRQGSADINALDGAGLITSRHLFDDEMGVASSDLTLDELFRMRSAFHRQLAATVREPWFAKTHDAFQQSGDGWALFPAEASAGCIYIVRNPLDVAISYAHHEGRSIDWAIARMADPDTRLAWWRHGVSSSLPEALSSWSGHVTSWLDQTRVPVHCVSYETMVQDPRTAFAGVLRFAGLAVEAERLEAALAASRFDVLRDQESAAGFGEKTQTSTSFFRQGRAGGWRDVLSREQVGRIAESHGPVMARLGYLDEARAFLDQT